MTKTFGLFVASVEFCSIYIYIYIYIYKARCKKHLTILEAIAIALFRPKLCRQGRQF